MMFDLTLAQNLDAATQAPLQASLQPNNGDVIVEPDQPMRADASTSAFRVVVVGSAQRAGFGDDLTAAFAYASREARRRGTRALAWVNGHYELVPILH